jgi:hypothetical protein
MEEDHHEHHLLLNVVCAAFLSSGMLFSELCVTNIHNTQENKKHEHGKRPSISIITMSN